MDEEENRNKGWQFLADLERKVNALLKSANSKRQRRFYESDLFKSFLLLAIYFVLVIFSLFKVISYENSSGEKLNWISEFLYIFDSDVDNNFPYFRKYLKIDPILRPELNKEDYLKAIESTLFYKTIWIITLLIQISIVLFLMALVLFILVEQFEKLFDFLENSVKDTSKIMNNANQIVDTTNQVINKAAGNTSKIIINTAENTSQVLSSTAENLKQRSYMTDLRNIFHGIKEFFHGLREAKESAINLGKEIIQLWKEA